jgi:hypothetical protein
MRVIPNPDCLGILECVGFQGRAIVDRRDRVAIDAVECHHLFHPVGERVSITAVAEAIRWEFE